MRIALPFAGSTEPLSRRIALACLAFFLLAARPTLAQTPPHGPATGKPNPQLTLVIAKRGTILIELYPHAAPKTVARPVPTTSAIASPVCATEPRNIAFDASPGVVPVTGPARFSTG